MVAKKGRKQSHHFAHYATSDGRSCVTAGETALHKFAKKILDSRLEIALPSMTISQDGDQEIVAPSKRINFDKAILENREREIVPDVVLYLRDRRLIIEFVITHRCDEQKITRIREMDIAAIEIDLSHYHDRPLDELTEQILYSAPRTWLHNPRERSARARLEQRVADRAAKHAKIVHQLISAYEHQLPSRTQGTGDQEITARLDGLSDLINFPVDGAGCFTTELAEWQSTILLAIVDGVVQPFRTRNALAILKERGWVNQQFAYIDDNMAMALKDAGVPFATPLKAVEQYLRRVQRLGFIHPGHSESWIGSEKMKSRVMDCREKRQRPARHLGDIQKVVTEMISKLPELEIETFEFETWVNTKLPERSYSIRDALEFEEWKWRELQQEIAHVPGRVRFSPSEDMNLFGLPYGGELERALERKRQEAAERELAIQEKEATEARERVSTLKARAIRVLGIEAEQWLSIPNKSLGMRSPLEMAASDDNYHKIALAIDRRREEIKAEEHAQVLKEKAVAKLYAMVISRYFDREHADFWMNAKRPELGWKSPNEFTIDDLTCKKCLELLPSKRFRW